MTEAGRMLVVDDDSPVGEVLSEYFVARGFAVVTAGNGREALEVFVHDRPDVVLLDMRMPEMDGIQVLKRLKAEDPNVPVIMATANDDVTLARETLALGAFDYVAKPFDFEYLTQTVTTALVHSTRTLVPDADAPPPRASDGWIRLLTEVFRTVRGMGAQGREATGTRLQDAALSAARAATAGRPTDAAPHLLDIELLARVASELGDLSASARSVIDAAVASARSELPPR